MSILKHTASGGDPTPERPPSRRRATWRPIALAAIGASALVTSGAGVIATLTATTSNVSPQTIESGTLKLTMANNGTGFTQGIANLAPGDTVNRFLNLQNGGSLDAQALTFSAAATGTSTLITDGAAPATTKALRVGVTSCSVAWNTSTGACPGTTTSLLAPTTMSAASQAQTLVAGAIASAQQFHLRVQVTLPDQDETTVNGVLPAQTVQGGSVNVTYTFSAAQRSATTTNS